LIYRTVKSDSARKVFTSLFSKSDRRSNARSVGRASQGAKFPFRRFLLLAFLLRLVCQKKSGKRFKKDLCRKSFLRYNYLISTLAFFFGTRGAKKKA
jgi:hypothetical protein